jgi:hypothetical protein
VNPSNLKFSSSDGGDKVFRVSVRAPIGESFKSIGFVVIQGVAIKYPSVILEPVIPRDGVIGRIDIQPYYDFQVVSTSKYAEVYPGKDTTFQLFIENLENIHDEYSIMIEDERYLSLKGLECSLSTSVVNIPEDLSKAINLTVEVQNDFFNKHTFDIVLNISSLKYFEERGVPLYILKVYRIKVQTIYSSKPFFYFTSSCIILLLVAIQTFITLKYKKTRTYIKPKHNTRIY